MKKRTIAIDIDDVLSAENDAMREFVNDRYSLNLTAQDYMIEAPYWGYWEHVWGVSGEEARKRYQAYLESGAKARHAIVEGAINAVTLLQEEFELVVVTSRDDAVVDITHKWLENNFPKSFGQIAFVPLWDPDRQVTKAIICEEIGASYLIDDNAEHCNLAAQSGVQALLFGDYGWNRHEKIINGVVRVKDWQAVKEYFGV